MLLSSVSGTLSCELDDCLTGDILSDWLLSLDTGGCDGDETGEGFLAIMGFGRIFGLGGMDGLVMLSVGLYTEAGLGASLGLSLGDDVGDAPLGLDTIIGRGADRPFVSLSLAELDLNLRGVPPGEVSSVSVLCVNGDDVVDDEGEDAIEDLLITSANAVTVDASGLNLSLDSSTDLDFVDIPLVFFVSVLLFLFSLGLPLPMALPICFSCFFDIAGDVLVSCLGSCLFFLSLSGVEEVADGVDSLRDSLSMTPPAVERRSN